MIYGRMRVPAVSKHMQPLKWDLVLTRDRVSTAAGQT